MKLNYKTMGLLVAASISVVFAVEPVTTNSEIAYIANKVTQAHGARLICATDLRCSSTLTGQYYASVNNQPVWINSDHTISTNAQAVIDILRNSYKDGLNPYDYHTKELHKLTEQIATATASGNIPIDLLADFDVTLTDAYLLYSRNMQMGRVDPISVYKDWNVDRKYVNVLTQFQNAVQAGTLVSMLNDSAPKSDNYTKLKQQLHIYLQAAVNGGWQTIPVGGDLRVGMHSDRVILLKERLIATNEYHNSDTSNYFSTELKDAVLQYQTNHAIKATGVVDKATLQSLNTPVALRIKQLEMNMDRLRWLPTNFANRYVWVNIPAYSLDLIDNGKSIISMAVIVGGGGQNKTCVVNSSITSMELNPYWGIPNRIATKEYLGKIQTDPTYLDKHDIRVYSNSTKEEVDPTTIDWATVTPDNFNYFLKQDPGKKNALGKVKFLFNNACGIYLHDTSNPNLFAKMSRSLSHGCVRISQPIQLANYLVNNNTTGWSQQRLNDSIKSGDHKWVKVNNPLEIHIVYQTTWVNSDNQLQFRRDIYGIESIDFPVFIPHKVNDEGK